MARPRNDTALTIKVKGVQYSFYGYAKDMAHAMEKTARKYEKGEKVQYLNTGENNEVAIYVEVRE